jgi:formamidopyrimidine-DNA glycosylase
MPELPEVEIVVQCLNKLISGRTIESAQLRRKLLAPDMSSRVFASRLRGTTIVFVHRRGKHILFNLDNGRTLITHLRMSGRFMLLNGDDADPKFAHAVFHLSDGERLVFQDTRHFGLMKIVETSKLYQAKELAKLAPEPFSDGFSETYLFDVLRGSKREIKLVLLDQTKVCGVGNIYASEALFLSRIDPRMPAYRISKKRAFTLRISIIDVLNETLSLGQNIPLDRENIGGNIYGAGSEGDWRIYGRENEWCSRCGCEVRRIVQGGRSTFFCRKCQRR